jgi:AcrR family transcriptional regulator
VRDPELTAACLRSAVALAGCRRPGDPPRAPNPFETSPMSRNRKAQTHERIVEAAMQLFARRGYERTSITQVAAKAGVSRAAVFWHFGDKAGLFREAGKRFLVPFQDELDAAIRDLEPRKRLFEIFAVYEDFVSGTRAQIEAFVRWVLDSPEPARLLRDDLLALHDRYRREIEAALLELLGDPAEARQIAEGLLSLLDGNLLLAIFGADRAADERRSAGLKAIAERVLKECGDR